MRIAWSLGHLHVTGFGHVLALERSCLLVEHECVVSTSAIEEWSSMSMELACTSTKLSVLRLTSLATTVAEHAL
jgi:hypothetical protein